VLILVDGCRRRRRRRRRPLTHSYAGVNEQGRGVKCGGLEVVDPSAQPSSELAVPTNGLEGPTELPLFFFFPLKNVIRFLTSWPALISHVFSHKRKNKRGVLFAP
jgi:hypothetical protein